MGWQLLGIGGGGGLTDPSSIAGLEMWLKADAIVSTDGTALSQWDDSSGNGKHATQATGSKQPTYQTNEQNGLPGVQFDGTDDFMLVSGITNSDASRTVFVVAERTNAGGTNDGVWAWWTGSGAQASAANQWSARENQAAGVVDLGACVQNVPAVMTVRYTSAASADGYLNAGSATNFDPADEYQINNSTAFSIGAGRNDGATNPLHGFIYELLMYNSALSDADRGSVRAYLTSKWAL